MVLFLPFLNPSGWVDLPDGVSDSAAADGAIWAALQRVQADALVARLPRGLDTPLEEVGCRPCRRGTRLWACLRQLPLTCCLFFL